MTPNTPMTWNVAPYFIVDDVVVTANFYRDKLGFHYARFWGDPPCFCMVKRSGIVIMLSQVDNPGSVPQPLSSRIERVPLNSASAEPLVFLPGRPAAERAADGRRFGLAGLLIFLKLALWNNDRILRNGCGAFTELSQMGERQFAVLIALVFSKLFSRVDALKRWLVSSHDSIIALLSIEN